MRLLGDTVRLSVEYVSRRNGRPRHEVEEWIASALHMRRLDLYLSYDRPLTEAELSSIRPGLVRMAGGEPLAHILGRAPFYGHEFIVSPDVLIPRPETETLVERAIAFCRAQPAGTIFDVCTGSGCIGLSLKAALPEWNVELSDISHEAVSIAKRNAARMNLSVAVHQGDLLTPFCGKIASCITCNPPYLSSAEWEELDPSVTAFEPRLALESGPTGIEFYERMVESLPSYLSSPGLVLFECSPQLCVKVASMCRQFFHTEIIDDLFGRQRVVAAYNYEVKSGGHSLAAGASSGSVGRGSSSVARACSSRIEKRNCSMI